MRVHLRSYGAQQELYVDNVLVLSRFDMDAREALEALGELSGEMEFYCDDVVEGGDSSLFDAAPSTDLEPWTALSN